MSDEDIISTLAYTKSPKFSKRTTFQDELEEALFARAARQQSAEYSEDFESDEENSLKEPETLENTPKKSVAYDIQLSAYKLCNTSALRSGSAGDLTSSDEDERPQRVTMLEREGLSKGKQAATNLLTEHSVAGEESAAKKSISFDIPLLDNCSSQRETADYFNLPEDEENFEETFTLKSRSSEERQENYSISEEGSGSEDEYSQQESSELNLELDDILQCKTEIKPVPEPREIKAKPTSASAENISIPALNDYLKPSPQPRSVLRKSSHAEGHEGTWSEDKASYNHRSFSLSAPSSLTRLSDQMTTSKIRRALSESPGPEGPWIASSSSQFPIHFSSVDERTGDSNLTISGDEASKDMEQKNMDDCSDLKMLESGRQSPSVLELMMATVYEKNEDLHKSTENYLEEKLQTSEHKASMDGSNETAKKDKHVHKVALSSAKVALNASKDSLKEEVERKKTDRQKAKSSIGRSFSSSYLKKSGKASLIHSSTSSQYLGTLKFLDSKHLQKYSTELDKADTLRATVYQEWLEKKRIFLMELQRIKRNKDENMRSKTEKENAAKREEATASFAAWKAMKEKEAKKLADKKRVEEETKKKEAELNEKKKKEAQKAFEKWKEKKTEYLKQQIQREKRIEKLKRRKEEEIVAEKKKDSKSAVEKWNKKKEEFLKQKTKQKIQEKKKEINEQEEKEEQDKRALEEYDKWLEKKEKKNTFRRKQKKLQAILEDEIPPPWSPPGKTVFSRSYRY